MIKRLKGVIFTSIGFILSPLSWWNDIFVNIPLSYLFSLPFTLINKSLFLPSFIIGYLLSNVAGIILMQKGISETIRTGDKYKSSLKRDLILSFLYTLLIVSLFLIGIIKPPTEYLGL